MSELSRRDLLRSVGAAAAIAVPISALRIAGPIAAHAEPDAEWADEASLTDSQPVLFHVRDAARGEVSVLQGSDEVIVRDRQLVARVLQAARRAV